MPIATGSTGRLDGDHAVTAAVSKTCLVRFDTNTYSVSSGAVGRPVEVQAYADRVVIRQDGMRQDGMIAGEHARSFGRGQCIDNPWHSVPVLARKPKDGTRGVEKRRTVQGLGAAPGCCPWVLPANLERVRRKLQGSADGDRHMVAILSAVLADGLQAVEAACSEALGQGVHSADIVLNILARKRDWDQR